MKRSILLLLVLPFILFISCEDDHHDDDKDHSEVHRWIVLDDSGNIFMEIENPVINSEYNTEITLTVGDTLITTIQMFDDDDYIIEDVDDLNIEIDNEAILSATQIGDQVSFFALEAGTTEMEFQLLHDGHVDARTVKIPVIVN